MVLTETGLAKVFQRIKSFVASQLNSKASAIHTHSYNDLTDKPTIPTYSAGSNLSLSDTTFNVSSTPSFTSITVSGYTITVD